MLVFQENEAPITAVAVLAGDAPTSEEAERLAALLERERPLLLAADGGGDHLARLGLTPDLLLGDGDSLRTAFPRVERLTYPRKKDFSDGEAALDYALTHTEGRVLVLGALGGRVDHFLTNLLLPLHLTDRPERVLLSGPGMEAGYSRGRAEVLGRPGDTVSLVPLIGPVSGLTLTGLEYPLDRARTDLGSSLTVSNVLRADRAEISHSDGVLLVVHYFGTPD